MRHKEGHLGHRAGWLRALVLGANDGIISTAALVLGVAAAGGTRSAVLTAGVAGLVAGAVAMALGEYVSVSSQRDSERSDIAKEQWELEHQADHELEELTAIYRGKGLSHPLAAQVAKELTAFDALGSHLRDELGITSDDLAKPFLAAWTSAIAFSLGGAIPLVAAAVVGKSGRILAVVTVALVSLVALGYLGAQLGGARPGRPITRVVVGGAIAMTVTMIVGKLFGAAVN